MKNKTDPIKEAIRKFKEKTYFAPYHPEADKCFNGNRSVKKPLTVEEFKEKVVELCDEYNLSIAHEDSQGGFIIQSYSKENIEWLMQASIGVCHICGNNLSETKHGIAGNYRSGWCCSCKKFVK